MLGAGTNNSEKTLKTLAVAANLQASLQAHIQAQSAWIFSA